MTAQSNFFPQTPTVTYSTEKSSALQSLADITNLPELKTFSVVEMEQVHGNAVAVVTQSAAPRIIGVDAVITTLPNTLLVVRTADCVPILLYHPLPLIAVIHAGRRGVQQLIMRKVLKTLKNEFGIEENFQLWLGPHICEKCYQINPETDEHFNLESALMHQIHTELGGKQYSTTTVANCTRHNPDLYHSYRREGKGVKMNYSAIGLSEMTN